jgi:Txe/YoeB family toxin of Txe-Axe toxin-antitoxin module
MWLLQGAWQVFVVVDELDGKYSPLWSRRFCHERV